MVIYFVNKNSTIKGPYDIMDAYRNRIMKIGDVCIREDSHGVSVLLIVSETNIWNACKCIGYARCNLNLEGNTLLFFFDGLSKRYGRMNEIETLCTIFDVEPLHSFFTNASEILSYNKDLWDVSIFSKMLSILHFDMPTTKRDNLVAHNKNATKFEQYLSKEGKTLYLQLSAEGKTHREIYQLIRQKYPDDFRKSLKIFLRENSQSTIYDT